MNSFGTNFRISIFGESHGPQIGVVIDGVPAGILLDGTFMLDLNKELSRRSGHRPDYSNTNGMIWTKKYTTARKETKLPEIVSGVYQSYTTGAPLTFIFNNIDTRSQDYHTFNVHWRPGHTDFVARYKYFGFNDPRGSGHFSGRMTTVLVAAGMVAKKVVQKMHKSVDIFASIESIHGIQNKAEWQKILEQAKRNGDSVGGVVHCVSRNMPAFLGEPFFNSMESMIAHMIYAIPGVRGVEFGSGFESANMFGSECNDIIENQYGHTTTNHCGGINGGITNGNMLDFKVAFKPTSTIGKTQFTYNIEDKARKKLVCKGRHDVAFVLRTPPIVEACTWIVLADMCLAGKMQKKEDYEKYGPGYFG